VYRALGGGWQIRLGGGATPVPLSEPAELPDLEEIPEPGEQGHDIQFPSLISESAILNPVATEEISQTAATSTAGPEPIKLVGTNG
jgi:hypothetical protein